MDNNYPLVSVVFTSYNHKEYLKQALDSLVNQTYPNLEIIVIDDCSTDGSQDILLQYGHLDNVSLKLQNHNSGSYVKASNFGARFASGEYLLFAQCDDFAEEDQIQQLVDAFVNNPSVGVVFSRSYLVNELGDIITDDFQRRESLFKKHVMHDGYIKARQMKDFLTFACVIPNLSAALIKRSLFDKINGLSENYLVVADWEFWLDMTEHTDFFYISEPLNYFRQHSTTIRNSVKIKTQISEIYKMFYNHISKYQLTSDQIVKLKVGAGAVWFSYFIQDKKMWFNNFFEVKSEIIKLERKYFIYLLKGAKKHFLEYFYLKIR